MGKLMELMQPSFPSAEVEVEQNHKLASDNMLGEWASQPYAQLSVALVRLRFLAFVHQTHHWIARGDSFYGDHKLFEQLYSKVVEEIDDVAEKAVGMGSEQNVDLLLQTRQLARMTEQSSESQSVPNSSELAKRSLAAECAFLKVVTLLIESLKLQNELTPGVENMLQQLADNHERHVYLLKRRCATTVLGF